MGNRIGVPGGIQVPAYISGECPPNFGFPEERIREVHRKPTQTHDIRWQGLLLRLYLKSFTDFTDVVAVQIEPKPEAVCFAMHAFPDLCDIPLAELSPLQLVEKIAERFGLDLSIAGNEGKFFLTKELPIPPGVSSGQITQIANPNNHSMIQSFYIKFNPPSVSVAMAFCLDMDEYGKWIKSH